ncbi:KAR9 multi-domain protein [Pyrenophora tritici-repentis]|nr:KAR9 multi-domain protein [Pyrenophora tritici-repentis]
MSDSATPPIVNRSSPATAVDLPAKTPPNPSTAPSTTASSPKPLRHTPPHIESTTKLARNVSPGLLARMKFLNQINDNNNKSAVDVGRIEQDRLRRLDEFRKARSLDIERRGTAWSGRPGQDGLGLASQRASPLVPQSTGESVPALLMEPDFMSDHSSVVSTSDKVLPSESEADVELDMQKYRLPDTEPAAAPTPPPKDTPPLPLPLPIADLLDEPSVLDDNNGIDIESYFQRRHYPRAGSIYTLSKASFTNQIQQLTSMKLPPTTIASEITALPSATLAGRALHKAANDIRLWITKTKEVLSGLDAEDDVEWAAAAGREGLAEVDIAIGKFEGLVNVYICAIEDLQSRSDIALLPAKDQTTLVSQMEDIVMNWGQIKQTLRGIKNQVEVAMEWEELWNNVLGEIGAEVENLSRLVFEMEERRHRVISDSVAEAPEKFDISELETIVEELPRKQAMLNSKRFSMPPTLAVVSPISPIPQIEQENSRLLALFAKLQPLRASLDFLPMRLNTFQMRARSIFPSACDELLRRKEQLEAQEKKLEAEADALREELGEDKWVHSFRQAGSKAVAMYESCMKSIQRLQQAIDDNEEEKLSTRIATYKDKSNHYPPSMRRVLELIDIEMKHRSTVNGEILRIQQDVRAKVEDLETVTANMDAILADFTASRKLRDSVSTVLSARTEASFAQSNLDTPGTSPASSVVLSRNNSGHKSTSTSAAKKPRQTKSTASKPALPANRRYSSVPLSTTVPPRKSLPSSGRLDFSSSRAMAGTAASQARAKTPTDRPAPKPRWNSDTHMRDTVVGHNFKPLTLTTPSPFRKDSDPPELRRSTGSRSSIPVKSPLGRSSVVSSPPSARSSGSTTPAQRPVRSLASPMRSPATPAKDKLPIRSTPGTSPQPKANTPASDRTTASGRQVSVAPEEVNGNSNGNGNEESPAARRASRPPSASANRRSSFLHSAKQRTPSTSAPRVESSPASATGP